MARLAEILQANHGEGVTRLHGVPGADEKRRATNMGRYGAENVFAKESSLFDVVQTAAALHRPVLKGDDNPFAWPEVQEKIRQANLAKYGVENPQQSAEVRARVQATNLERYGVEEVRAVPEVRRRIEATHQERYGGPTPSCSPAVVEKARQTNLERWGVEWTAQHPEVRQKQLDTMIEHFGAVFGHAGGVGQAGGEGVGEGGGAFVGVMPRLGGTRGRSNAIFRTCSSPSKRTTPWICGRWGRP